MISIQQRHKNAVAALNQGQLETAHQHLVHLLRDAPDYADGYFLLGVINLQVGQLKKAVRLFEKALGLHSSDEYRAQLTKCYALQGELALARQTAEQTNPGSLTRALDADTFGVALSHVGLHENALAFFRQALQLTRNNPQYYYNFGVSAKFVGQFNEAEQAFEQALALDADHHRAHFALSDLKKATPDAHHIGRLQGAFERASSPESRLHLGHALAKEYQDLGKFNDAYQALQQGKAALHAARPFDHTGSEALFERIQSLSQAEPYDQHGGHSSREPIFVLGMPRSGTTLVERILSSHSDVMSAGELQDFGISVKRLAQTTSQTVLDPTTLEQAYQCNAQQLGQTYLDATRVVTGSHAHFVDKLPFNFFYVDLIRRALPNAKIVCLMRDPMDTCIGNFRQLFTINNPYYAYSLDLMDTARFYARFYHLMQHWKQLHGEQFYMMQYESLVDNPEQEISKLLAYCELSWQDSCMHFHLNDAPVSTASKVQVREPLNRRAIGRWKRFAPHTDAAKALLNEQGILF
ncbi:sulfotransferase family protein [Pseudoalteromonas sp. R3]|uniref:tetratricopeptide repeat-containing sulfotransferase family protein n=1 Tax=Pseudoalteromonas sp. R3 TaxID=1709477 RepID=UPI0006B4F745|nr:sulfotransferase family protein [Pseudoalteromonas sp. R3]AZZ97847.1 sulfotransferase family protein [Pseudoalteromonas sp. R3]